MNGIIIHSASVPITGVLTPGAVPTPAQAPAAAPQAPNTAGGGDSGPTSSPAAPSGGAGSFVKWSLAMVALWFTLTALYEYGGSGAKLAPYLAGLVLFGVLYYQGPRALENLKGQIGQ